MFVKDRMTKNPIVIKPETPMLEAMDRMKKARVHRFPIVDTHHKVVGIVTEKDLVHAGPSSSTTLSVYEVSSLLAKLKVSEMMTQKVLTIQEDTPIEEAARIMADNNIGGLPVMRGTDLVGIITESDIFKVFIEMLGSRDKGLRVSLTVNSVKGGLASIASAVAEKGGNILSLSTFLGQDLSQGVLVLKVDEISRADLESALSSFVKGPLDIRET